MASTLSRSPSPGSVAQRSGRLKRQARWHGLMLLVLVSGCSKLADDCTRTLTCTAPDAGGAGPQSTLENRPLPTPPQAPDGGSDAGSQVGPEPGETDAAPDGGGPPIVDSPRLDQPCSAPGELACNGEAQKLALVCQGGAWSIQSTCPAEQNCDNTSGVCRAILPACAAKPAGARFCQGKQVHECGADLVSDSTVAECVVGCTEEGEIPRCSVATQVVSGQYHTCALLDTGRVRCWGENSFGQLGYASSNTIGDDELPSVLPLVDVGGKVTQLAAGDTHTCALLEGGGVRCWGRNADGQLGYGNTINIGQFETPASAPLVDVGDKVEQLAAGGTMTCALVKGGAVRCWGATFGCGLGYGDLLKIGDDETPASIDPIRLAGTAIQVVAGTSHACVLLDDGSVRCWGCNGTGQLGYGTSNAVGDNEAPADTPTTVPVGGIAAQLAAGPFHTCALLSDGNVRCWGLNDGGQLGIGDNSVVNRFLGDDEPASAARIITFDSRLDWLSAGYGHSCAVFDTGAVHCWGGGGYGELGLGRVDSIGDNELPAAGEAARIGGAAVQVSTGRYQTCAVLDTGAVRCWGYNAYGQLGYGHTANIGDDEPPSAAGDVSLL